MNFLRYILFVFVVKQVRTESSTGDKEGEKKLKDDQLGHNTNGGDDGNLANNEHGKASSSQMQNISLSKRDICILTNIFCLTS